jgi:DNA repair ATPase RecN
MLDERGVDVENDTVVLRREVNATGRARAWVNGSTVTAAVLAEVGRLLVNLHGQHEAQTLLDTDAQRQILDAFGGATEQANQLRVAYEALSAVRRDIQTLESVGSRTARGLPPARLAGDRRGAPGRRRGRAARGRGASAGACRGAPVTRAGDDRDPRG